MIVNNAQKLINKAFATQLNTTVKSATYYRVTGFSRDTLTGKNIETVVPKVIELSFVGQDVEKDFSQVAVSYSELAVVTQDKLGFEPSTSDTLKVSTDQTFSVVKYKGDPLGIIWQLYLERV